MLTKKGDQTDEILVGFLAGTDGAVDAFAIYSNPFSRKVLAHPLIETVNDGSEVDSFAESLQSRTRRRFASW
jgi:hypothetical protein